MSKEARGKDMEFWLREMEATQEREVEASLTLDDVGDDVLELLKMGVLTEQEAIIWEATRRLGRIHTDDGQVSFGRHYTGRGGIVRRSLDFEGSLKDY